MIKDRTISSTAPSEITQPYLSLFEKLTPLIGCHSEEEICRRACVLIAELVEVHACSILTADPDGQMLHLQAATHIAEAHWDSIEQPSDRGATGRVFQENQAILIRTAKDFEEQFGRAPDSKYSSPSCIIVPVSVDELSIGVINIAHPKGRAAFESRDVELLEAATRLIGAALRQAVLFNRNLQLRRDLQNIVDSIPAGVAVVDSSLRMQHLNARGQAFFGDLKGSQSPTGLKEWLPCEMHGIADRLIRKVQECHQSCSDSMALKSRSGRRELRLLVSPVGGLLALNDDMLVMVEEIGIEAELDRLRQAESIKNSILSTLFHELRTPLAVIRGAVPLIQPNGSGPLTLEMQSQVHTLLANNTKRLTDVVNTMLDVTEIENGSIVLREQQVDLRQICEKLADKFQAQLNAKAQKLELNLPPEAVVVEGDERRLRQVLDELMVNAIKFGAKDSGIRVELTESEDAVDILVSNESQAICEKDQELIFQKFYQCDQSMTRSVGGIGLGLYLVANLVQLHRGKIKYEHLGQTRVGFRVNLPRVDQSAPEPGR